MRHRQTESDTAVRADDFSIEVDPEMADLANRQVSRRQFLGGFGVGAFGLALAPVSALPKLDQALSRGSLPGTLRWALPAPVNTLDPTFANITANTVHSLGYESLLVYNSKGQLGHQLARSWSHPNLLTYVFKLRGGVKFWDGSHVTPADVVYSLNRVRDPKTGSGWGSFYSSVSSIRVTGHDEITIKLTTPDPLFRFVMGFAGSRVISQKFAEAHPSDYGTTASLTMGTGPYRFSAFSHDTSVVAQRNPHYWGRKAEFDQVEVSFITDETTRQLAMRSGSIDGAFTVPLDQIPAWKSIHDVSLKFAPELYTAYLAFDTSMAPWNDVHVRRAFAYALDRKGLVASVKGGYGQVAPTLPTPQQWIGLLSSQEVHKLYSSLPYTTFDLGKAQQELAKSSVPHGFNATITYPDAVPGLGLAMLNLAQNLKHLGVTLTVKEIPFLQWHTQALGEHLGGINVGYWSATTTDASEQLNIFFNSKFAVKNAFNLSNYKNPKVDALLDQQRKSRHPATRAHILSEIVRIVANDVPMTTLWYEDIAMAISSRYTFSSFNTWNRWQDWPGHIGAR